MNENAIFNYNIFEFLSKYKIIIKTYSNISGVHADYNVELSLYIRDLPLFTLRRSDFPECTSLNPKPANALAK